MLHINRVGPIEQLSQPLCTTHPFRAILYREGITVARGQSPVGRDIDWRAHFTGEVGVAQLKILVERGPEIRRRVWPVVAPGHLGHVRYPLIAANPILIAVMQDRVPIEQRVWYATIGCLCIKAICIRLESRQHLRMRGRRVHELRVHAVPLRFRHTLHFSAGRCRLCSRVPRDDVQHLEVGELRPVGGTVDGGTAQRKRHQHAHPPKPPMVVG
mmetsp:Transcript_70209/g.114011  ORF Transcript_70209/g.114011 Transcript_70209/m.114011 type:complete len:214 (+) Transcript_70209:1095-1736(+)